MGVGGGGEEERGEDGEEGGVLPLESPADPAGVASEGGGEVGPLLGLAGPLEAEAEGTI